MLYRDETDGSERVVERKSLVWPLDYAEMHKAEHVFMTMLSEEVASATRHSPYVFALSRTPTNDQRRLSENARAISREIRRALPTLNPGEGISGTEQGLRWSFWREHPSDRDDFEPSTGLSIRTGVPDELSPLDPIPPELEQEVERHLKSCGRKFADYGHARQVVLVEHFGGAMLLGAVLWSRIAGTTKSNIGRPEIWRAWPEPLPDGSNGWIYDLLYDHGHGAL
jgi:hypothetical protein